MIINRVFQILKVILYILLILLLIGAQAIEMMRTYVPKNTHFFKKYENVSGKINYPSSNKEISILYIGDSFVNGVGGSKKQIEKYYFVNYRVVDCYVFVIDVDVKVGIGCR